MGRQSKDIRTWCHEYEQRNLTKVLYTAQTKHSAFQTGCVHFGKSYTSCDRNLQKCVSAQKECKTDNTGHAMKRTLEWDREENLCTPTD